MNRSIVCGDRLDRAIESRKSRALRFHFASALLSIVAGWREASANRLTALKLRGLNDHHLRDIGLTRADVEQLGAGTRPVGYGALRGSVSIREASRNLAC